MKPLGFGRFAIAGCAVVTLYIVPSSKAASVDFGTIAIGTNVNASILNSGASLPQTYTYNSLVQGPNSSVLGMTLPNGNTVAQELTALGYAQNNGVLDYNFPFALGASGSYSQNGTPPFSIGNGIAPGNIQSLTATSVMGNVCTGSNNVGATISVDPTNAAATYDAILGCDPLNIVNSNIPTSSTSTAAINLGTYLVGGTETTFTGEETVTTWEVAGIVNEGPVSGVPEPSALWLGMVGLGVLITARIMTLAGPA